jgi:hypothetical protein
LLSGETFRSQTEQKRRAGENSIEIGAWGYSQKALSRQGGSLIARPSQARESRAKKSRWTHQKLAAGLPLLTQLLAQICHVYDCRAGARLLFQ